METVKYRWKLRPAYFKGPGPYFLRADTEDLSFDVDAEGYFEIEPTDFPLGIFAKHMFKVVTSC